MSHPGYPNQQNLPYPAPNSTPYPPNPQFQTGAPMYMPQPYSGTGYPPAGITYPHPGSGYPQPGGGYPLPGSGYPHQGSGYPHAATGHPHPGSSHPGHQAHSYPLSSNPHQVTGYPHPSNQAPFYSSSSGPHPATGYPHPEAGHPSNQAPSHTSSYSPKRSPTVVPAQPFSAHQDAEVLRKAMKGLGTDEKAIINVLTKRINRQRLEIAVQFKILYGKDLIKELKSELGGNFEKLVLALMTPLPQYYAEELHEALSGLGTKESVLIEILCSLSNAEIYTIKEAYKKAYGHNLESDLKGDTSGHFRRLMVSVCCTGRDESMVTNPQAATADAAALYKAGEKKVGTDESTFNAILCQRNYAQLRLVFQEYQKLSKHDIEKAIKSEFSGDVEDGLLAVVRSIKNQPAFFARQLNRSMKGMGTKDRDLIRLVVTRSEIDMGDIKREYAANHKESLADAIKSDTSGDYRKCLLALIGAA